MPKTNRLVLTDMVRAQMAVAAERRAAWKAAVDELPQTLPTTAEAAAGHRLALEKAQRARGYYLDAVENVYIALRAEVEWDEEQDEIQRQLRHR